MISLLIVFNLRFVTINIQVWIMRSPNTRFTTVPTAPQSGDFVKDILEKSIFQAIHVYGFLKTPFDTILDPFGLSDDTQARVPRRVHEP